MPARTPLIYAQSWCRLGQWWKLFRGHQIYRHDVINFSAHKLFAWCFPHANIHRNGRMDIWLLSLHDASYINGSIIIFDINFEVHFISVIHQQPKLYSSQNLCVYIIFPEIFRLFLLSNRPRRAELLMCTQFYCTLLWFPRHQFW